MSNGGGQSDLSSEEREAFGPIDAGTLRDIRDLFVEREPLVEATTLDDPSNPGSLAITLSDGVGEASGARFDVRWTVDDQCAFHYTDEAGRDCRFDCHHKPDAPTRHFHPPPDATARPVDPSCITVAEIPLVVRAVLKAWRAAYDSGDLADMNDLENPP